MHINSLGAAKWPGQMRLYTTSPRMSFDKGKRVHCINTDENNARPIYVVNSVDLPVSECTVKEIWIPARGQFILEKEPGEMLVTDAARTVYAHSVSYGHDGANRIVDSLGYEKYVDQSKPDAFTTNVDSDHTLQMVTPEPWQQRRTYDSSLVHCVNVQATTVQRISILNHPTKLISQCEVGRIFLPPGAQFTLKKKPDEYLVAAESHSIYAHATSYHGQQIIEPIGIPQVLTGYYPGTTQTGTDIDKAQLVYCCNDSNSYYAQIVILSYSEQWEFTKSVMIPPKGYMVIKKEPSERLMFTAYGGGPPRAVKVTFTNV